MSKKSSKKDKAMEDFASKLLGIEKKDEEEKMEILKDGIHKRESELKEIKHSKSLNQKVAKIREDAGMSRFVGTKEKIKSPRIKRKQFIEELAREVLDVGLHELSDSGYVTTQLAFAKLFSEIRPNWKLKKNDIKEAIQLLEENNIIPKTLPLKSDVIIRFKATELSDDVQKVLITCDKIDVIEFNELVSLLGWIPERVKFSIEELEKLNLISTEGDELFFFGNRTEPKTEEF